MRGRRSHLFAGKNAYTASLNLSVEKNVSDVRGLVRDGTGGWHSEGLLGRSKAYTCSVLNL